MLPNHTEDYYNSLNNSNLAPDDSGFQLITHKSHKGLDLSDMEDPKIDFSTEGRMMTKVSTNKSLIHDMSLASMKHRRQKSNLTTDESDDIPGVVRNSYLKKNITVAPEKNMVEAIDLHVPTQTETPNFNNKGIKVRDFYSKKIKSVTQDDMHSVIRNQIEASDPDFRRPPTPIESQIMTHNTQEEIAIKPLKSNRIHEEFLEEDISDFNGESDVRKPSKAETGKNTAVPTAFATVEVEALPEKKKEESKIEHEEAWETIPQDESHNKTISQNDGEKLCRICLDGEETKESGKLIRPCQCDGSMKLVHEECLKTWIISKGYDLDKVKCEVCHVMFVMNFKYGTKFYPKVACEEGLMSFLSCLCLSGMIAGLIMIIVVIVKSWTDEGSSPQDSFSFKLAIVVACGVISGILMVLVIVAMKEAFFILEVKEWDITNYDPRKIKKTPKRRKIVASAAINRAAQEFQENHSLQLENRSQQTSNAGAQQNLTFNSEQDMSRDNSSIGFGVNNGNDQPAEIVTQIKQAFLSVQVNKDDDNDITNKQVHKIEIKNNNRGKLKQKITKIDVIDGVGSASSSVEHSMERYPKKSLDVPSRSPQSELSQNSSYDSNNLFLKDIENISRDLVKEDQSEDSFVKVKVNKKSVSVLKPAKSDPKINLLRSIDQ